MKLGSKVTGGYSSREKIKLEKEGNIKYYFNHCKNSFFEQTSIMSGEEDYECCTYSNALF